MLSPLASALKTCARSGSARAKSSIGACKRGRSRTSLGNRYAPSEANFPHTLPQLLHLKPENRLRNFCTFATPITTSEEVQVASPTLEKAKMPEGHNVEYYNRTISSLLSRHDYPKAIRVYHGMRESSPELQPSTETYALCLEAFLAQSLTDEADAIYEEAKSTGKLTVALSNVYLQHYSIEKNMEGLLENWMRMELDGLQPDEISFTLKLKTLFHLGDHAAFNETWAQMQAENSNLITSSTYNLVSLAYAHSKDTDKLQELLSLVDTIYKEGDAVKKDPEIIQTMLLGFGYHGDYNKLVDTLNQLFASGTRITNAHCVAAMMGMCAASRATLAEKFIYQFVRKDLIRNKKAISVNLRVLYRILLGECIASRDAEVATRTAEAIMSSSVPGTDTFAFETKCMVQLHLEREEEDIANRYFERFLKSVPLSDPTPLAFDLARIYINHYVESQEPLKAIRFWNTHEKKLKEGNDKLRLGLEVFALAGDTKSARKLFDQLLNSGTQPTPEICQLVMRAYVNAKDPKRAIVMFEETQENGVAPNVGSYNIVAGVYASRGDIAKTRDLIESMEKDSIAPNAETYSHLMSAHFNSKKFSEALDIFEAHFKLAGKQNTAKTTKSSKPEASEAVEEAPKVTHKFRPTATDFTLAFQCAQFLSDKKKVQDYWTSVRASETHLSMNHFLPALAAATTQAPLFINILQVFQKRLLKGTFKLTYDHTKQLGKLVSGVIVSQHSPVWPDLAALSQQQGRNQLPWEKRKDWSTVLQRAVFDWSRANPQ